ncbi:MAG: hypothetical protein DRJ42_28465 [Deltaproteobacteria bacterium]|nr:MAG: hypothetical protein DRJ42_28465 [Deltaproteobacteria bacterium]
MAAGKRKPVRWTIPDVKGAPPRRLEASARAGQGAGAGYPNVTELMAGGTYSRGWLEGALCAVLRPVVVVSAMSLGATGCVDLNELLGGDVRAPPAYIDDGSSPAATLTPVGSPLGPIGASPSKPPVTASPNLDLIPPCPLPPLVQPTATTGATPPAHPPAVRGRMRPIRVPPPPPPAPDPPALDGEVAVVRPQPPTMPGGLRVVHPTSDGGT